MTAAAAAAGAAEIPNPRLQIPRKLQTSISKKEAVSYAPLFEYWRLRFAWDLDFGIWDFRPGLGFGISASVGVCSLTSL
jgi:hypothetical protein